MLIVRRGDVILVPFPESNQRNVLIRPALVVQADELNGGLPQIIVAAITRNMNRAKHPSRVAIYLGTLEGVEAGLIADSVVMTDNLATIRLDDVLRIIGNLPMLATEIALRHTLALKEN